MAVAGLYKINQLQPWMAPYVQKILGALDALGVSGSVVEVFRSGVEQEKRFDAGDTAAHAGQSAHQYGLAFDFVVSDGENSARQLQVQQVWKWLGYHVLEDPIAVTGGKSIYDRAHVEWPGWKALVSSPRP